LSHEPPGDSGQRLDGLRACVGIPVYNHRATIGAVVRGASVHASTVLVYDDGSTDGSGEIARTEGAEVLGARTNQGKGVALKALMAEAERRGFRSLVCLDADGQHLPEDLPRFADALEQHPGVLLIGVRNLEAAGAPESSRFGRRFSNFWIWLETGVKVADSQSGFRAYPLPETLRLPLRARRYDFETEVLVRSLWAGVDRAEIPIRVLYPHDRITHFDRFRDNAGITWRNLAACGRLLLPWPLGPLLRQRPYRPGLSLWALRRWVWMGRSGLFSRIAAATVGWLAATQSHAGLRSLLLMTAPLSSLGLFLPLVALAASASALPKAWWGPAYAALAIGVGLFETRQRNVAQASWSGKSRTSVWGYRLFIWTIRWIGLRGAHGLLYPVVLYYVLTAHDVRAASMAYLQRVLGPARGLAAFRRTFRHVLLFAQSLVDRAVLATHGPSAFSTRQEGLQYLEEVVRQGRGALLLTAHIGNWDLAASLLQSLDVKLSVVAFEGEEERLRDYLKKIKLRGNVRVIPINKGELAAFEILRALRDGELVALQGDRLWDARYTRVPFFGQEAPFPTGLFALSAISGAPIVTTFALKDGPNAYRFIADPPLFLSFTQGVSRQAQLDEWAAQYARRVESLVKEAPFQWFNFYDFWNAMPPSRPSLP
jgi:predicted LPLAT superfamily acyltransferase/glycosyltransferase involved in cell wall biosynthesis